MSISVCAFHDTEWYDNLNNGIVYLGDFLYTYKGSIPYNTSITVKEGTSSIVSSAFCGYCGLTSASSYMYIYEELNVHLRFSECTLRKIQLHICPYISIAESRNPTCRSCATCSSRAAVLQVWTVVSSAATSADSRAPSQPTSPQTSWRKTCTTVSPPTPKTSVAE